MRVFFLFYLVAFPVLLQGQELLTTDDIIEMVEAGLTDSVILLKISQSRVVHASVQEILELKQAGASNRVISVAMGMPAPAPQQRRRRASNGGNNPRIELFGGYSFAHVEDIDSMHGFNAAVNFNFTESFGLVIDTSAHFTDVIGLINVNAYSLLFAPQFSFRSETVTPFIRPLVGFSHLTAGLLGFSDSITAFTVGGGGGLDVNVADHLAIRAVQADYLHLRAEGGSANAFRLSVGVVGKW